MKETISNWNNYPVIESNVKTFSFKEELEEYFKIGNEFIPRGNGRSYGDASLGKHILCTTKFDKVLSFETKRGVFVCQSGVTLDKILKIILLQGWFLPVTPGTKFITIGGAVASDIHGKNHRAEGSFCKHVEEIEIMLQDGAIVLCSRKENEDLFEATCGGMGLTGVILNVKFHLKKIETSFVRQKCIKTTSLEETLNLFDLYKDYTYSVAWVDCLGNRRHFGRSILLLGEHAEMNDLTDLQKEQPLVLAKRRSMKFPFTLPSWILNTSTIKLFNYVYYFIHLQKESTKIVSYNSFFYPLDSILHWNKGYGKKRFLQYQFVLPLESKSGLIEILQLIRKNKIGSFMTVLKMFGPQDGLINFPMQGYTFALDFPLRKGVFDFLDKLDQFVLRYGGRLYLAKDARMKPEIFRVGYPNFQLFLKIIDKYNPQRKISSLQSDRLIFGK